MRRGRAECAASTQGKGRLGHDRRSRRGSGRTGGATARERFASVGRSPGAFLSRHRGGTTCGGGRSEERRADGAKPQQRAGGGGFGERKIFGGGRNSGRVRRARISILPD